MPAEGLAPYRLAVDIARQSGPHSNTYGTDSEMAKTVNACIDRMLI